MRFKNVLALITVFMLLGTGIAWGLSAFNDEYINGNWTFENDVTFLGDIAADGISLNGVTYTWPATAGTATYQLTTDGAGTLSWAAAGAACPWDDLSPPDANESLDHTVFWTAWDFGDTDHDMFNIIGSDDFGDVSIVKIEQSTGDPTDGTVLEVVSADTDADALLVTANAVNVILVNGDGTLTLTGNTDLTGNFDVTGDMTVSGTWGVDAVAAATATQTLTLNGDTTGGVNIGSLSTGDITLGADIVVADGKNVTIGEGSLTIDNDATGGTGEDALIITSSATTANSAIDVTSANTTSQAVKVVALDTSSGDVLYLGATDATLAGGGNYIKCYDNAATDFNVARYGATTIAGNASTNVLTITAGDIQITNGDIDLDNGQLMVDTTQDLANNISRNYNGVGGGPVLTVKDDHTASTNQALYVLQDGTAATAVKIDQTGTGNSTGIDLNVAGDLPAIDIDASAARDGDAIDIAMANMLDERALNITGAITGAAGEGVIEVHATGNIANTASLLRLDSDTGTPGGSGFAISVDDDSLDGGDLYAVLINTNANEGLHVASGVSLFAEAVTFTAASVHNGGLTVAEDIDIDFNAADEEINLTNSAEMDDGLAQVTIYNSDADLTDGDLAANMYLLRLMYKDQADPDGAFLSCEDNDGDELFVVDAGGEVTAEGDINANGNIVGDGATEMTGVVHDIVDGGAGPITITAAMSGTVFINSEACEFDLPADGTGTEYTFMVANASNLHIDPAGGDTIDWDTCAAGDRLLSATVGDSITLVGISASLWMVKAVVAGDADFSDVVWTDAD